MDIQRQAFQEWYIANHHDGDIHPNQQLLEWSEKGGFYFASSVEDLWEAWQAAKSQAVPEGFVLVNKKDLVKVLNCVTDDWLVDTDSFEEFKKIESLVQDVVNAMIEAQEQSDV